MTLNHLSQVDIGQYVGVMYEKRFIAVKPLTSFQYAASRIQQLVAFIAYVQLDTKDILLYGRENDEH